MTDEKRQDTGPERERAEAGIQRDKAKGGSFVRAVEATRMPMVVTDATIADNPIIFANPAFLELCGYGSDEILGQNYFFLTGPKTDADHRKRIARAMNAREEITEEVILYTKDGREIWVSVFIAVTVENDRVTQHFASFLEITARVEAERRVTELNAILEDQVAHRTHRLEEANQRLRDEITRRQRVEATLRDALDEGQALLVQKDVLIREVHHRTKNALAVAASLLQVQASRSGSAETRQALRTATIRLSRIAEVYSLLEGGGSPDAVDASAYLHQLAQHLLASQADPEKVTLKTAFAPLYCDAELIVSMGLIVTEALTNAFKYAFTGSRAGTVALTLRPAGAGVMQLRISDDGVGLSGDRRPGAFGLDLIDLLARRVKGAASIDSAAGRGMTITVAFPTPGPSPA